MLRTESPRCQEFAQDLPNQNVRWWTVERQEFLRKRRMRRGTSESPLLALRWTRLSKLDRGSGRDATVLDGPFRRGSHGALAGIILLGRDHSFRSRQPRGDGAGHGCGMVCRRLWHGLLTVPPGRTEGLHHQRGDLRSAEGARSLPVPLPPTAGLLTVPPSRTEGLRHQRGDPRGDGAGHVACGPRIVAWRASSSSRCLWG